MMKLYAKIPQEEVIYKGKIRKTGNGQNYWITIDQVVNKGVHPDNDHTCRCFLSRNFVGKKCFVILDDDWG